MSSLRFIVVYFFKIPLTETDQLKGDSHRTHFLFDQYASPWYLLQHLTHEQHNLCKNFNFYTQRSNVSSTAVDQSEDPEGRPNITFVYSSKLA